MRGLLAVLLVIEIIRFRTVTMAGTIGSNHIIDKLAQARAIFYRLIIIKN